MRHYYPTITPVLESAMNSMSNVIHKSFQSNYDRTRNTIDVENRSRNSEGFEPYKTDFEYKKLNSYDRPEDPPENASGIFSTSFFGRLFKRNPENQNEYPTRREPYRNRPKRGFESKYRGQRSQNHGEFGYSEFYVPGTY
jgi:hypothetical protein